MPAHAQAVANNSTVLELALATQSDYELVTRHVEKCVPEYLLCGNKLSITMIEVEVPI
jgi:hypothetical protein